MRYNKRNKSRERVIYDLEEFRRIDAEAYKKAVSEVENNYKVTKKEVYAGSRKGLVDIFIEPENGRAMVLLRSAYSFKWNLFDITDIPRGKYMYLFSEKHTGSTLAYQHDFLRLKREMSSLLKNHNATQ